MNKEVEEGEEEDEKDRNKKKTKKKIPANHRSADDMDFNEPEYLQMRVRDEISQKHKADKAEAENGAKKEEEAQDEEEEDIENGLEEEEEEENGEFEEGSEESDEEGEDDGEGEYDNEDEEEEKESKKADLESKFEGDQWLTQFELICNKLNKKTLNLNQFEKSIRLIIEKLNPANDEKNKERLCLLTQRLVEYYQSLFDLKSASQTIDFNLAKLCTAFIFELTSKYGGKSTRKEPSIYVNLFKRILSQINDQFVNLKSAERKFPELKVVSEFFKLF